MSDETQDFTDEDWDAGDADDAEGADDAGAANSDPAGSENGSSASETRLILANMASILEDAGTSLAQVVKTTVWLASMLEAEDMNGAYRPSFPDTPPARTVCGARLNYGMKVQIDCIAQA